MSKPNCRRLNRDSQWQDEKNDKTFEITQYLTPSFRNSAQRFIVPQKVRQAKLSAETSKKPAVQKKNLMEVAATNSSAFYKVPQSGAAESSIQHIEASSSGPVQRKTSSATHIDVASMLAFSEGQDLANSLSRRLTSSTEGRFTIIDEHYKESTDESFDDSDEDGAGQLDAYTPDDLRLTKSSSGYCISFTPALAKKKQSIVNSSPNIKQMTGHRINCVGSRFKIVPVESRYKRGRWQAWDYYLDENGHYCHTNTTHAPVVEDGQFRVQAVHLTGDSFPAHSKNSISNLISAVSQPNPLQSKLFNPPKIAVVPPTPLLAPFELAPSSSASPVVPINPFSFVTDQAVAPALDVQPQLRVPSTSLINRATNLADANFMLPSSSAREEQAVNSQIISAVTNEQTIQNSSSMAVRRSPSPESVNSPECIYFTSSSPKPTTIITDTTSNDNISAASSPNSSLLLIPSNALASNLQLGSPGSRQIAPSINIGRPLTPSAEMLLNQYGLERSLSATSSYNDSPLMELNRVQQPLDERQLTHDRFNNKK